MLIQDQQLFMIGPDGRPVPVAGMGRAPVGPWTPGAPYATPQRDQSQYVPIPAPVMPNWRESPLDRGLREFTGRLEGTQQTNPTAKREPAPYTKIPPALERGWQNLQKGLDPRANMDRQPDPAGPWSGGMPQPAGYQLPSGMGGPGNMKPPQRSPGRSTVPTPQGDTHARGLPVLSRTPQGQPQGQVVQASAQPQPQPTAQPNRPGMTFANYFGQLQQALGTGETPEQKAQRRNQEQGNALLATGMGMMAAGSQPGAGLFGSLGAGGMAGMAELNRQKSMYADTANKDRAAKLAAFNAAANLYGADQTRAATADYRRDTSRRADEALKNQKRRTDLMEAKANAPKPRDPEAARNDNTRTLIAIEKAAKDFATDDVTGEIDRARFQEEFISRLERFGMMNYPKTQADVDALPKGAYFYDPGLKDYQIKP